MVSGCQMKKIINIALLLLIVYLIFIKLFLNSIDHKDTYHMDLMDDFIISLKDKYHYIKDGEVVKNYGEIIVKIYYAGHPDLQVDDSLYRDIEEAFKNPELRNEIMEREGIETVYLKVEIIDNVTFSTKEMTIKIDKDE